jgi:hypothetical protein
MGKGELFACNAHPIPGDDVNHDDADQNAGSAGLRGLLVRDPYASQLLGGEKIWRIRGRSTHIRGPILIVKSGHQCRLCVVDRIW